jgi:hypothetical protein
MMGLVSIAVLLSFAGVAADAVDVRFGFDGFPAEIRGDAGSKVEIQGFATISTPLSDLPGSWCLVMTADGGEIFDVTVLGLKVTTNRGERSLEMPFWSVQNPMNGEYVPLKCDDPTRSGSISDILGVGYPRSDVFLAPDVVNRVAFLTVKTALPAVGESRDLVLRFEDGFCPPKSPAVSNCVIYHGKDFPPSTMVPLTIVLRGQEAPYRRGDADASGKVNLSDAVFVLDALFFGGRRPPCDRAADANADDKVDLSDVVGILNYLFRGAWLLRSPFLECGLEEWEGLDFFPDLHCASFPPCA